MSATLRLPLVNLDGLAELVRVVAGAGLPGDDARQSEWRFFRTAPDNAGTWYGEPKGDGPDLLLRSVAVPPELRRCGLSWAAASMLESEEVWPGTARPRLLTTTTALRPFAKHPAWICS